MLSDFEVSPVLPPTVQDLSNPLRGSHEELLQPLFPQGNPAPRSSSRFPVRPTSPRCTTARRLRKTGCRHTPRSLAGAPWQSVRSISSTSRSAPTFVASSLPRHHCGSPVLASCGGDGRGRHRCTDPRAHSHTPSPESGQAALAADESHPDRAVAILLFQL